MRSKGLVLSPTNSIRKKLKRHWNAGARDHVRPPLHDRMGTRLGGGLVRIRPEEIMLQFFVFQSVPKCRCLCFSQSILKAWGKRFLLFLPDSHSAYYNSFVSALGQSLPPLTGSFKDLLYLVQFLAETAGGEGGGWWAHPLAGSGNECGISRHWAV